MNHGTVFHIRNVHCLSLSPNGFNCRVVKTVSTPHSVVLGINTVSRRMPPIQAQCSRQFSATSLNLVLGEMAGRDIHCSQGFTVTESFKEKKAFNMVGKIKHQKKNTMSKMHDSELGVDCGARGRSHRQNDWSVK